MATWLVIRKRLGQIVPMMKHHKMISLAACVLACVAASPNPSTQPSDAMKANADEITDLTAKIVSSRDKRLNELEQQPAYKKAADQADEALKKLQDSRINGSAEDKLSASSEYGKKRSVLELLKAQSKPTNDERDLAKALDDAKAKTVAIQKTEKAAAKAQAKHDAIPTVTLQQYISNLPKYTKSKLRLSVQFEEIGDDLDLEDDLKTFAGVKYVAFTVSNGDVRFSKIYGETKIVSDILGTLKRNDQLELIGISARLGQDDGRFEVTEIAKAKP